MGKGASSSGGANALWLTEWLAEALELRADMRVLDLGCGRAMSSVGPVPDHLRAWWEPSMYCLHSAPWWRRHWEPTGVVDVADTFAEWLANVEGLAKGDRAGQYRGDPGP